MDRAFDQTHEHLLKPILLGLLNASLLIGLYLLYEVARLADGPGRTHSALYLAGFTSVIIFSLLILGSGRRLLLYLAITLHIALYMAFF